MLFLLSRVMDIFLKVLNHHFTLMVGKKIIKIIMGCFLMFITFKPSSLRVSRTLE